MHKAYAMFIIRTISRTLPLAAALLLTSFAAAKAPAAELFNRQNVNVTFQPKRGQYVIREEPVDVPAATWSQLEVGDDFALSFRFGAVVFAAHVTRIDTHSENSRSIHAVVPDQPQSSIIISVMDGVAAGWFYIPTAGIHARLQYAGPDTYMLREVNNAMQAACGNVGAPGPAAVNVAALLAEGGAPNEVVAMIDPSMATQPAPADSEREKTIAAMATSGAGDEGGIAGTCSAPQPIFDIVVLYTAIARAAAGGTAPMQAEVLNAIDVSNQAYNNSPINARMRLVHCQEVVYNEVGTLDEHRDRLADSSDGVLDSAHTIRSNYGADVVCMWVADDDGGTACGIAYCTPSGADEGFCIVTWNCAVSNFSMVHEVGHLLGSAHDPDNAGSGCNEYSYSYGHYFFIGGNWWHTVMAYKPTDSSERIPYFSNPNVNYLGHATGTASRNNTQSIGQMRGTVAGWFASRNEVWVDFEFVGLPLGTFNNPQILMASAVSQVNQGSNASEPATIWLKPGSSNQALTINEPVFLRACGSPVTIGQ